MRFQALDLAGLCQVEAEPATDARGAFMRLHCEREFAAHGLPARMVQTSLSRSTRRGTVRGMHFQWPPSREGKLVRCIRGRIHDVVIDLRPGSPTYARHVALQLTASDPGALFVPEGLAHGFQTLDDEVEVLYQMTDSYEPSLGAGVRWNDPAFGIEWPIAAAALSERDAAWPDFDAEAFARQMRTRSGATER
jgi:dTDP-4-dehydrorhamnose 3,5-epimerase